jgi:hypothetical protein
MVIVCIFVGNDISDLRRQKINDSLLIQDRWIWVVPARIVKLYREKARGGVRLEQAETSTTEVYDAEIPDFVQDPSKEMPTFSEEAFLGIEKDRVQVCIPKIYDKEFRLVGEGLLYLKEEVGPGLLVVLIPDEFQVNDTLWTTLTGNDPKYDRELPQKLIGSFCRKNGIRVLDLVPALREAEKGGRCYHLRDTHWNARGNKVAGENIAEVILSALNTQ